MCTSNRLIGQVGRVFTNDPGDLVSIPGRVIPKTFKMVLDTSLKIFFLLFLLIFKLLEVGSLISFSTTLR